MLALGYPLAERRICIAELGYLSEGDIAVIAYQYLAEPAPVSAFLAWRVDLTDADARQVVLRRGGRQETQGSLPTDDSIFAGPVHIVGASGEATHVVGQSTRSVDGWGRTVVVHMVEAPRRAEVDVTPCGTVAEFRT